MKKRIINNRVLIEVAVLLLLILCSIAVITRVITFAALPASFIGAALGAVITGLMTAILLKGQTASQEEKERNVKIFELKKDAFKKYINQVWDIWADHKVNDTEFAALCSDYYRDIAIYLDEDTSEDFVKCLIKIGQCIETETEENSRVTKENIFNIINILVKKLELGGSVNQTQHEELEKELFPGFFKKAIAAEMYKALKTEFNCLMEGKYDTLIDGSDYLTFPLNTMKTAGFQCAKFIVGPFKGKNNEPAGKVFIDLYIENSVESFPNKEGIADIGKYKDKGSRFSRRLIKTRQIVNNHDIYKPISKDDDDQEEFTINFADLNELKKTYGSRYQKVAETLAERAGKFIKMERIIEKDAEGNNTANELSYVEFLRKVRLVE